MLLLDDDSRGRGGRPRNNKAFLSSSSSSPPDVVTYSKYVHGSIFSVPNWKTGSPSPNDSLIVSIYGFLKSFLGASGSNQGAIDNRIEQAMDLVKSHLMNAVRSEVEELKERIVKLEDVITHLQTENDFLKANVSQDVLTQLPVLSQTQQQSSLPCSGGTPTTNNGGGGLSPTTGTAILQPLVVTTQQQPQL